MLFRLLSGAAVLFAFVPGHAAALSCTLTFTVTVSQGVGFIRPDTALQGTASFTTDGRTVPSDAQTTGHLAQGEMVIEGAIRSRIWSLMVTHRGTSTELVGIYGLDSTGLSFAGIDFSGPMVLTLFGPPGSRDDDAIPMTQSDWDRMNLRRNFALMSGTGDMLSGRVTDLVADCT